MVKERLWKKNSNISQIFGTTEKKEEDDEKYRITSNQHVFDRYRWESTIGPGDNRCYTPLSLRSFLILRTLILSLMSVRWIPGQKQFSRGDMTTSRGICTNQSKPQSKNYTSERYWVPKKGKILKKTLRRETPQESSNNCVPPHRNEGRRSVWSFLRSATDPSSISFCVATTESGARYCCTASVQVFPRLSLSLSLCVTLEWMSSFAVSIVCPVSLLSRLLSLCLPPSFLSLLLLLCVSWIWLMSKACNHIPYSPSKYAATLGAHSMFFWKWKNNTLNWFRLQVHT